MIQISDFIDARNENILAEVCKQFRISIEVSPEKNYLSSLNEGIFTIYYNPSSICKDSFTHELLHGYLKTKGFNIGGCIIMNIRCDNLLSQIFKQSLLEHISNCLEHHKMLPLYLSLGYNRTKFIVDYYNPKCKVEDVDLLRNAKISGNHKVKFGLAFSSLFFGVMACPNNSFDYSTFLNDLKLIDQTLFDIHEKFWREWDEFDIIRYDPIFNDYRANCESFCGELNRWFAE